MQLEPVDESTIATMQPKATTSTTTHHPDTLALLHQIQHAVASPHRSLVPEPPTTPPSTHPHTPLELEFHSLLSDFCHALSPADALALPDPHHRVLLAGIVASAQSPPVSRAFCVLYQDLLPLRLAGRWVVAHLRRKWAQQVAEHRAQVERCCWTTTTDTSKVEELRLLHVQVVSRWNEGGRLAWTKEQLLWNNTNTVLDKVARQVAAEQENRISFERLLTALRAAETGDDPHRILRDRLLELHDAWVRGEHMNVSVSTNDVQSTSTTATTTANQHDNPSKRIDHGARYDAMVASFCDWKEFLPPPPSSNHESRRMQVVRGCFVGAEIPEVVAALRIVYTDYRGLRMAGDIIFALVSKRMQRHMKARQEK